MGLENFSLADVQYCICFDKNYTDKSSKLYADEIYGWSLSKMDKPNH